MSETPVGPNPFERVADGGFVVPAFEELSPEQQQAIDNGPGRVTNPATHLRDYPTAKKYKTNEDYGNLMHNGHMLWITERQDAMYADQGMGGIFQKKPAQERFAIYFPELNAQIEEHVRNLLTNPDDPKCAQYDHARLNADPTIYDEFFVAHKLMSQLVDVSDEENMREDYLVTQS